MLRYLWNAAIAVMLGLQTANLAYDAAPKTEFEDPMPIMAGKAPIDVRGKGHAAPFVHDIDEDGKLDLLVGAYEEGALYLYRNTGTNQAPKFAKADRVRAGDEPAAVPTG